MKKILIIDDDEVLRDMISMALQQRGFAVVQAGDGVEGIELARRELPDLILCDVKMDKVDGYLTLQALRDQPATAAIPFILMTGLADNAGMRHGMELGADDYLPKPFSLDALFAAVDARLRKAQMLREEAERKLSDLRDSISLALPHELRTPLNGIMAYGEILTADAATLQPAEIAEMGQVIFESGKRLHRLIENFLIYARIELMGSDPHKTAGMRAKVTPQPGRVVAERAQQEARAAGRAADLILQVQDGPMAISEEYLAKIVEELVQNAFKFSSPGTRVEVVLQPAGDVVELIVRDQGRGIAPENVAKIGAFMQFDRRTHEQQGLGLGLIIAKRLTELHGGGLTVQSVPGQGTNVTVRFPRGGTPTPR